jgi:hypothetical protein
MCGGKKFVLNSCQTENVILYIVRLYIYRKCLSVRNYLTYHLLTLDMCFIGMCHPVLLSPHLVNYQKAGPSLVTPALACWLFPSTFPLTPEPQKHVFGGTDLQELWQIWNLSTVMSVMCGVCCCFPMMATA